jgi:hypothetical protein
LLKDHILGAVKVLHAAKANDLAGLEQAKTEWYGNATQIASFLARANPNLDANALESMMRTHLDQLTSEVVARLHSDWPADISAYDATEVHILHLADSISAGLVQQFPQLFQTQ